jgi:hypothetical protein
MTDDLFFESNLRARYSRAQKRDGLRVFFDRNRIRGQAGMLDIERW